MSAGRGPESSPRSGGRPARPAIDLEVLRTEQLTPSMVRVVLGGEGLASYTDTPFTDRYVKLVFPDGDQSRIRTYTVRRYDPDAGELWLDVVQHGPRGIAGPWAADARPGDRISLRGPGGGYVPDPDADWYLLVGDPAVYPAISGAIDVVVPGSRVVVVVRAHDAEEASYLQLPEDAEVHWVIDEPERSLLDVVASLDLPPGVVDGFVHGELGEVRALRRHLVDERGVPPDHLSISGYWREGLVEEEFQQAKREA